MISAATWGRVVGRLRSVPVVSTIHTTYTNRPATARVLDLSTSVFPDVNVSVSRSVAASLPPYFGLGARSEVVHNCVDPDEIRALGDVSWTETEWTDGIDKSWPIVANVTRFDPKKRKVDLVRALPTVHETFPNTVVVLTGWGPRRRHVEEVARSLDVEESVWFVGHVSNPYTVYRHSDIVALPSISEGFSIGILEAMSFAKPIVATDIPPFREALGPQYPLVPTRNPGALAEVITSCLSASERADKLGRIARERVETQFSGRSAAQSYLDIYRSVSE
jgi:glycosyltransferase involved in cell wall biosynthesis